MIPLSTTTISVLRLPAANAYDEPYGGAEPLHRTVIASGVPAVIDAPGGSTQIAGGVQAIEDARLVCDNTDLNYLDLVRDDATGTLYRTTYIFGFAEDHLEAGLRTVEGEV